VIKYTKSIQERQLRRRKQYKEIIKTNHKRGKERSRPRVQRIKEKRNKLVRPRGVLLIIRPRKRPFCKGDIHKTLLKNKIRKLQHGGVQANISQSFGKKACDIEVIPNTPRQLPRRKASQLIP